MIPPEISRFLSQPLLLNSGSRGVMLDQLIIIPDTETGNQRVLALALDWWRDWQDGPPLGFQLGDSVASLLCVVEKVNHSETSGAVTSLRCRGEAETWDIVPAEDEEDVWVINKARGERALQVIEYVGAFESLMKGLEIPHEVLQNQLDPVIGYTPPVPASRRVLVFTAHAVAHPTFPDGFTCKLAVDAHGGVREANALAAVGASMVWDSIEGIRTPRGFLPPEKMTALLDEWKEALPQRRIYPGGYWTLESDSEMSLPLATLVGLSA